MNKYQELMGHLQVTEEMEHRILGKVQVHFQRKRQTRRIWFSALGLGAAAALMMLVIRPYRMGRPALTGSAEVGMSGREEYSSAKELSEAVGFLVPELTALPFLVKERIYSSIGADCAQIEYVGTEETLGFVKCPGIRDYSGDYNIYPQEKKVSIQQGEATLRGQEGKIYVAFWTDGTYACSLYSSEGLEEKEMILLIEQAEP